jgi:hypothetical protein
MIVEGGKLLDTRRVRREGRDAVWLDLHTEDGLQGRDTQDTGRKIQSMFT